MWRREWLVGMIKPLLQLDLRSSGCPCRFLEVLRTEHLTGRTCREDLVLGRARRAE